VAAATDGDEELLLAREPEGRDDVVGVGRPDDEGRPPIDHAVPDGTRCVVAGITWTHDLAGEAVEEVADAFALSVADVRWALAYETSLHAA
jgi:uncharacterized protein (DUF433 family)